VGTKLVRTDRQREKYFLELMHQLNTSTKPKVKKEQRNMEGRPSGKECLKGAVEQGGLATTKRTVVRGRTGNKIHHK